MLMATLREVAAGGNSRVFYGTERMTDSARVPASVAGPSVPCLGRIDHMRLVRLIGRGPQAAVYLAEDTMAGRRLAAKLLPANLSNDGAEAGRLRRALVAAAHFSHSHVTGLRHLHAVWEADSGARVLGVREGSLVLVSDYIDGTDLRQWLASRPPGPAPRAAVLRVFRQVAEALDAAHAYGVSHGALTAGNILIRADGEGFVSDLSASYELRRSLRLMGTSARAAASPAVAEDVTADAPPAPAEDVQAFAQLLVGALSGDLSAEGMERVHLADLSPAANEVLAAALSPDPSRRPTRCAQIVEAMAAAAEPGLAVAAEPRPAGGGVAAAAAAPVPVAAAPVPVAAAPVPVAAAPVPVAAAPVPVAVESAPVSPSPGVSVVPSPPPPPSRPVRAIPPVAPVPPAAGPRHRRPRAVGVNLALGSAAGLLVLLAGAWLWHERSSRPTIVREGPAWTTVAEQGRLAQRFAYSLVLGEGAEAPRLRFRLLGQTRRLDLLVDGAAVSVRETRGTGRSELLAQASLPAPCGRGDMLTVAATPSSVALFINGVRAAAAPWPVEAMTQALWQVPPGAPSPGEFRMQKIATLLFADDFMHGEQELGEWKPQTGTWTVHALQNPIRSANPFSFLGQGEDALATAGQWFWRDYRFAVAAHPLAGASFGVKACWTAPDHAYEVLWSNASDGAGTLSLTRVAGPVRTELAKTSLSFAPAQWYHIGFSQVEGVIDVSVDGTSVLAAVDPNPLLGGGVGLWTRGGEGTVFDDVSVGPVEQVSFDFSRQSSRGVSLLRPVVAEAGRPTADAGFDVGGIVLENARVTAVVQGLAGVRQGEPVELLARRRGGEELGLLVVRENGGWVARLLARQVGRESVLAEGPLAAPAAECRISLHVLGSEAWGVVDGGLVVFAGDVPVRGQGTIGLRLPASSAATRRSLEVAPERPLPELENRVETFTHEASMQNWSSPVLEWNIEYGDKWATYWHRSDFWQDLSAVMRVTDLPPESAAGVIGLALRNPDKPADAAAAPRVALVVDPEAQRLQLLGLAQGTKELKLLKQRVSELALERRRGRVLARLNGQVVWNEPLPDALRSLCEVGRFGRGNTKEWAEAVTLRAGGVETYPFKHAPVEWFPVGGVWEITNRWQCDPRWSFYSGVQRGGVACNWNKTRHGQNVTVEFFAGPKMDQERGRKYEYAADINAVICADGRDIRSGYSFLFGGWDDRGSQIVRGNTVVGENRRINIPRESSTHRRWFYIKLRKAGNRLSFWVDGSLVATYEDAAPLTGDRFGLWTWDNGIMVAQCRVSTDGDGQTAPTVSAGQVATPKTPYDPQ